MFTGLVQKVGTLGQASGRADGMRLVIRHAPWSDPLECGESVAVQGACLTVTQVSPGEFTCDVLRETLERTTLGGGKEGAPLNLERALRASDRLGGHFVTGHVDGIGKVAGLTLRGDDWILEIEGGPDVIEQVVYKGSIAVDGVSLTVAEVRSRTFTVHLIPHTWKNTSLHALQRGAKVNLETDLLGKYVLKQIRGLTQKGITMESLAAAGFK